MSCRQIVAASILGIAVCLGSPVDAGRFGGPASSVAIAPAFQSVFVDIPFNAGQPAIVQVVGSGTTALDVLLYDGDGNVATSTGFGDRKTVSMAVYRTGIFRLEVRNLGPLANACIISTN
jgi:hypothetical protein